MAVRIYRNSYFGPECLYVIRRCASQLKPHLIESAYVRVTRWIGGAMGCGASTSKPPPREETQVAAAAKPSQRPTVDLVLIMGGPHIAATSICSQLASKHGVVHLSMPDLMKHEVALARLRVPLRLSSQTMPARTIGHPDEHSRTMHLRMLGRWKHRALQASPSLR